LRNQEKMLQEKSPILIMFKSRSIGDYGSLKQLYYRYNYHHRRQAQPQQQEQENQQLHRLIHLYHFSRHFDHETCITHTLCNAIIGSTGELLLKYSLSRNHQRQVKMKRKKK
jgi:hypothetical protein